MTTQVTLPTEQDQANNRRRILDFEATMFAAAASGELPPCDFPLQHTFTEGAYARQMTIPAGSVIIGKIHRHAHFNFILKGHVKVMTDAGVQELKGPCYFVSTPGTKRVVTALEETLWVTIHVTESQDLAEIEQQIIASSFADLQLPVAAQLPELERTSI